MKLNDKKGFLANIIQYILKLSILILLIFVSDINLVKYRYYYYYANLIKEKK